MNRPGALLAEDFVSVAVPLWREALLPVDWLSLRASPVYHGRGIPHGDGAPVVLIPGFLGSDGYLAVMYNWLQRIGYRPYLSRIGRNSECPEVVTERLFETMDEAFQETGRKLHLIGHSLGGLIARGAAIRRPRKVAQVVALGSPVNSIRAHPAVLTLARFIRGRILWRWRADSRVEPQCYTAKCTCKFAKALRRGMPPSVARASIFTKSDGIVDWRSCLDEDHGVNIEVRCSHGGLVFSSQAYEKIALLLAGAGSH